MEGGRPRGTCDPRFTPEEETHRNRQRRGGYGVAYTNRIPEPPSWVTRARRLPIRAGIPAPVGLHLDVSLHAILGEASASRRVLEVNPKPKMWTILVVTSVLIALAPFIAARTIDYWRAWVYLGMNTISSALLTLSVIRDPILLEGRTKGGPTAEKRPIQRIIVLSAGIPTPDFDGKRGRLGSRIQ